MASIDRITAAAELILEDLPSSGIARIHEIERRLTAVCVAIKARSSRMVASANDTPARVDPFERRPAVTHLVRSAGWTLCGYHITSMPKGDIWASTRDRKLVVAGTCCRDCETEASRVE